MKKMFGFSLMFIFLMGFIFSSCQASTTATKDLEKSEISGSGIEAPSREASSWEAKWADTLVKAKKERRVFIYTSAGADTRIALTEAFKAKYGIDLDVISGKSAQLSEKLITEIRAGLATTDVLIFGTGTIYTRIKTNPLVRLAPLDDVLMLPEVRDPKMWWDGKLPLTDKERQVLTFTATPSQPFLINTQMVKKEELASYQGLLNPKWTEKIIWQDPTISGSGATFFLVAAHRILGLDYFKELAKLKPAFTRDQRLQVEWITRGKYPIGIGASADNIGEFTKAGAPIEEITPKEGTYLSSSGGNIMLLPNAPHPSAARIFINWMASKEAQDIWTKHEGVHSARVDATTQGLPEGAYRKPGAKYISADDEEINSLRPKYMELAGEMFGIK